MENNELNPFGLVNPEEFKSQTDAVRSSLESTAVRVASASLTSSGGSGSGSSSIGGLGSALSAKEIQEFIKELIKVQEEYSKLSRIMTEVIGNKAKADEVMTAVREMASKSPFDVKDLAEASNKLLTAGTSAGHLAGQLKMLGDVAAGSSMPLDKLTDAFIKLTEENKSPDAATLTELASQGIPIYTELSKVMGKNIEDVKELAKNGAVGIEDVKQAMENLTKAGGTFHEAMQVKAVSFTKLYSDLKNGWDGVIKNMYGENSDLLSGNLGKKIAENYTIVGEAISALKNVHSIYKAAQAASLVIESASIVVKAGLTKANLALTASQVALNTAMNLNPYVAVASAIVALVSVMSALGNAQKRKREEQEASIQPLKDEYLQTNILVEKLNDANLSEEKRRDILAQLKEMNPELTKGVTDEANAYSILKERLVEYNKEKQMEIVLKRSSQDKALEEARNKEADTLAKLTDTYLKFSQVNMNMQEGYENFLSKLRPQDAEKVRSIFDAILESEKDPFKQLVKLHEAYNELLENFEGGKLAKSNFKVQGTSFFGEYTQLLYQYNQLAQKLEKDNEKVEKETEKMGSFIERLGKTLNTSFKTIGKFKDIYGIIPESSDQSAEESDPTPPPAPEILDKAAWEKKKQEAQDAINGLDAEILAKIKEQLAGVEHGISEDDLNMKLYVKYSTQYEEANKNLKPYNLEPEKEPEKPKGKTRKELEKEVSDLVKEAEKSVQQLQLDLLVEGKNKRLTTIEKEYTERAKQIGENEKKLKDLYKKLGDPKNEEEKNAREQELQLFKEQSAANEATRIAKIRKLEDEYFHERIQHEASLTAYKRTEETKRVAAIKERYNKERKWALEQFQGGSMSKQDYEGYNLKVTSAESGEILEGILNKHKDYNKRREDIERDFNEQMSTLRKYRNAENEEEVKHALAQLEKQKQSALGNMEIAQFKENIGFDQIAANMELVSSDSLRMFRDKLADFIAQAAGSMSEKDLKPLSDMLKKADLQLATDDPFKSMKQSLENYRTSLAKVQIAKQQLAAVQKGQLIPASIEVDKETGKLVVIYMTLEQAIKKLADAEANHANSKKNLNKTFKESAIEVKEYMDAAGKVMGTLEDFGVNVPESLKGAMQGVSQTVESLSSISFENPASIITGVAGALSGVAKTVSSLFNKDNKKEKEIKRLQKEIDGLQKAYENLDKAIDKAFSSDASKMIDKQNELLEQQKLLIQKQIQEENNKKKTDKSKIEEWNKQIEQINEQLEQNREKAKDVIFGADLQSAINDFAQAYMNAWEAGEDKATAMKDVVDNMIKGVIMEAIKGDLASKVETLRNKILQMLDGDGMIDENEIEQLYRDMQRTTDELNKRYEKMEYLFEAMDEVEPYTQEATRGGFEAMSQETAGELNGRFTALQIAGEEIKLQHTLQTGLMTEMASGIDTLRMHTQILSLDVSEIKDISFRSMDHLAAIEKNTKHLQYMRDDLARIKNHINNL